MLFARERRAERQRRLIGEYSLPLLSFTMNIAGPVKNDPLISFAFDRALEDFIGLAGQPLYIQTVREHTGCEAICVFPHSSEELKAIACRLEDGSPAGRLFDMDIIGPTGAKLSRDTERRCLICGGPVSLCSRSRAHSVDELWQKSMELLMGYAAEKISQLSYQALFEECRLSPKPGLVDMNNNGAHRDMDLELFVKSAAAISPYIRTMALRAMEGADMARLQAIGREAEQAMYSATGGVNTHKGSIYIHGLIAAGFGLQLMGRGEALDMAAELARDGVYPEDSHGGKLKKQFNASGARGEAASGFPHLRSALAVLDNGGDELDTLLHLMSRVEDTNLLWRGGIEGLSWVQDMAEQILASPVEARHESMMEMDRACIKKNLSPGGSADLLSAALFMRKLNSRV